MAERKTGRDPGQGVKASLDVELEKIYERREQRRLTIVKIVIGLFVVVILVAFIDIVRNVTPLATDPFTVGGQATMSRTTMLGVDDDAFSEMMDLQTADDQVGLNLLMQSGRTFVLTLGTRVLIIERRFGSFMVQAMEGPYEGMSGWVQSGRIRP